MAKIDGSGGDDTLDGTAGADVVTGGQGADSLRGGGGNDVIAGDSIWIDPNDHASTDGSPQTVLTVVNDSDIAVDLYWIDQSGDLVRFRTIQPGETFNQDTFETHNWLLTDAGGTRQLALIEGGSQTYTYGPDFDDRIDGGSGDDTIYGEEGNEFVFGGTGRDTIFGGSGDDTLAGAQDDDTLYGGDGRDTFLLTDGAGRDSYFGGGGGDDADTIHWISDTDAEIVFDGDERGTYGQGGSTGTFSDIERIETEGGDDRIDGSANGRSMSVQSGGGHDTVTGGAASDTLSGEDGNDTVRGGGGADTVSGGAGDDTIHGDAGNDRLIGGDGDDLAYGGEGDDLFDDMRGTPDDGQGNDTVFGGAGDDEIYTGADNDHLYGGAGNDRLDGEAGDDTLDGGDGDDHLFGGTGDDRLAGGGGADTLFGGAGADTLSGGAGNDTLTGGTGDDTFELGAATGTDTVTDFDLSDDDGDLRYNDQIDVGDLRTEAGDPVTARDVKTLDDGQGNAMLVFPGGERLILRGVAPSQMTTAQQLNRAGIPCFTAGTMILTPRGEVAVETLRPGDMVITRDDGPRPIVWVGLRQLDRATLAAQPDLLPVRIAPGGWAGDRGLLVSPQHGIAARSDAGGGTDILVRARHLARMRGGKVRVATGVRRVSYVHIAFARHQVVFSNGIASESFYPGPWGLRTLDPGPLRELLRLFPDLGERRVEDAYGEPARPVARARDLPRHLSDLMPDLCP